MKNNSKLLIIVLLLAPVMLFSQKKFNPEIKLSKGQSLTYLVTAQIDMVQNMMGQEMKINISTSGKTIITVDESQKGKYLLSQISRDNVIEMKMDVMDTVMQVPEMNNLPSYIIDKFGKILSRKNPENSPQAAGGADFSSMSSSSPFVEFPGKKLTTGDTWETNRTDTMPFMGGSLQNKIKMTYTLIGKETKDEVECLKLTYKGSIQNEGATTMQGMDFYIEGTGAMEGTCWLDISTGITLVDEGLMENEMTLALTGQQNFTIPMTYKTTITRKKTE